MTTKRCFGSDEYTCMLSSSAGMSLRVANGSSQIVGSAVPSEAAVGGDVFAVAGGALVAGGAGVAAADPADGALAGGALSPGFGRPVPLEDVCDGADVVAAGGFGGSIVCGTGSPGLRGAAAVAWFVFGRPSGGFCFGFPNASARLACSALRRAASCLRRSCIVAVEAALRSPGFAEPAAAGASFAAATGGAGVAGGWAGLRVSHQPAPAA